MVECDYFGGKRSSMSVSFLIRQFNTVKAITSISEGIGPGICRGVVLGDVFSTIPCEVRNSSSIQFLSLSSSKNTYMFGQHQFQENIEKVKP